MRQASIKFLKWLTLLQLLLLVHGVFVKLSNSWDKELSRHACVNLAADKAQPAPVLNDEKSTRFVVLGDSGELSAELQQLSQAVKDYCAQAGCDFGLMLGDNFYERGVDSITDPKFKEVFADTLGQTELVFYPVLGNHDVKKNPKAQVDYSKIDPHWLMPDYNYHFSTPHADFYGTNSNCLFYEYRWLKEASQRFQQADKWQVSFRHHSLYSTGSHGNASFVELFFWHRWFKDFFDINFSGHNHQQELSQHKEEDTIYVVSGAASRAYNSAHKPKSNHDENVSSKFVSTKTGYLWAELSASKLELRFLDSNNQLLYQHQKFK